MNDKIIGTAENIYMHIEREIETLKKTQDTLISKHVES